MNSARISFHEFIREDDIIYYGSNKDVLYKVTRVKQVKFLAVESNTGRRIEGRLEHAHKADNPDDFIVAGDLLEAAPELALGMAVRWKEPDARTQGVFVTIGKTAAGWKVARLGGGDGMRYWHSIDGRRLEAVPQINNAAWE